MAVKFNAANPVLVLYTTYLNIGVDGLQALEHYNFEAKAWGQVHHQVRFTYPQLLCIQAKMKTHKRKIIRSLGPLLHHETPAPRWRGRPPNLP